MKLFLGCALLCLELLSCTVYRSPQRREFESEYSGFQVKNLNVVSCSHETQSQPYEAKRLVTVLEQPQASEGSQSIFMWEYKKADQSLFESDNLKGDYCVYKYQNY